MSAEQATTQATTQAEREHAERSSSQLGNLALCEGYRPRKTDRVHWVTAQGQRGHEALDTGDSGELESGFEERMVKLCEGYCATLPTCCVQRDELKVDTISARWGFVDRLRIRESGTVADLIDWKFVRVKEVTDAEINLQGKDYVCGVFDALPILETIHVHFVMPRFGSVSTAPFVRADVPRLKLEILAVLARSRRSDHHRYKGKTLRPHFDVCQYCGALSTCRAIRAVADEIGRKYDPEGYGRLPPVPEQTHASLVTDPKQNGQLQRLATLMLEWGKSVHHHNATRSVENVAMVPDGYELDWQKGKRRLTSAPALLLVAKEFNLEISDLVECAQLSWGKVEDLVRERAPKGKKGFAVNAFNDRLRELDAVERADETPRLVRK